MEKAIKNESHERTAIEATEPRKAPRKLQHGEGYDPKFVVLALPCQKFRKTMMRRSRAAAVRRRQEQEEAMAREAPVGTAALTSAPALAGQGTWDSASPGPAAAAALQEAIPNGEAVHETRPNPGNTRKSFDPNSVVLALPCPSSRKAAAPGRVAAEASSRARDSGWCPPPPDVYKINVHGISFSDDSTGDAGIGLVVRDSKGGLIASMSRKVKGGSYSGSVEDCAISLGLEFGHDLGLARVFMEGDFAKLGNSHLCSSYLLLNKESVEKYSLCKFGYVKEEANLVAHKLACYAVRLEDCIVWMEDPPDFIEAVLALDACGIKS